MSTSLGFRFCSCTLLKLLLIALIVESRSIRLLIELVDLSSQFQQLSQLLHGRHLIAAHRSCRCRPRDRGRVSAIQVIARSLLKHNIESSVAGNGYYDVLAKAKAVEFLLASLPDIVGQTLSQ